MFFLNSQISISESASICPSCKASINYLFLSISMSSSSKRLYLLEHVLVFIWSNFTAGKLIHIMHPHSYIQIFKNAVKSYFIKLWTHSTSKPFQAKVQFKPLHVSSDHSKNLISESHDFEINREQGAIWVPRKMKTTSHHRCDHDSEAIPMHKQRDTALFNPNVHGVGECVFISVSCSKDPSPSNMHTHTQKLHWN